MTRILRLGLLLLVPLVGLSILNCREEDPTQPEVQPETIAAQAVDSVQLAKASADAVEIPTLTATELLTDPWLELLLGQLTITDDAEKIRQALAALAADVEAGDAQLALDHIDVARDAVADYDNTGDLDPDDAVTKDLIDFFLDAVEEMLPEADDGPPEDKRKDKKNFGGQQ